MRVTEVARILDKIADTLVRPILWLGYVIMAVSASLVFVEVITRYGFGVSHAWSAETSKYSIMVLSFLVAGVLIRKREHFHLTFLIDRLKGRQKTIFQAITLVVSFIVLISLFFLSIPVVQHSYLSKAVTEQFTFQVWWLHAPALLLGFGLLSFYSFVELLKFFCYRTTNKVE